MVFASKVSMVPFGERVGWQRFAAWRQQGAFGVNCLCQAGRTKSHLGAILPNAPRLEGYGLLFFLAVLLALRKAALVVPGQVGLAKNQDAGGALLPGMEAKIKAWVVAVCHQIPQAEGDSMPVGGAIGIDAVKKMVALVGVKNKKLQVFFVQPGGKCARRSLHIIPLGVAQHCAVFLVQEFGKGGFFGR